MPTYSISGQALAGSTMTLTNPGAAPGVILATTLAGPTGSYTFSGLANGSYLVTPARPGIAFVPSVSATQTIASANITGVNFLGTSVGSAGSTYTIQNTLDRMKSLADIEPIFNVAGYSEEPMLTIANDVINEVCGVNFPHKWNRGELPVFYTWSWQQDYALVNPDNSSLYDFEWLEKGVAVCISSNQVPKPFVRVECGRDLPRRTGTYAGNSATQMSDPGYLISWMQNADLYYGTWGQPNVNSSTWGNNPQPGSFYQGPLGVYVVSASWSLGVATFTLNQLPQNIGVGKLLQISNCAPTAYNGNWVVTGIPGSAMVNPQVTVTMPNNPGTYEANGFVNLTNGQPSGQNMFANPISQIIDANGNLLVITTYGTEGTTAPLAAIGATPGTQVSGTGAQTIWTVVDPIGMGIRILDVPSQTGVVWQFTVDGQFVPPKYTSLDQLWAPLPDKYEPFIRAGCIAQAYNYSKEAKVRAKFVDKWAQWQKNLINLRETQDREIEEWQFITDRTIMGGGTSRNRFRGPAAPFNNTY